MTVLQDNEICPTEKALQFHGDAGRHSRLRHRDTR